MQLTLRDNLPFTQVTIAYQDAVIDISNVLVDTGSATTIVAADIVSAIDIVPSPLHMLYTIPGVGGAEVVFTRHVDIFRWGCGVSPILRLKWVAWIMALKCMVYWGWIFSCIQGHSSTCSR